MIDLIHVIKNIEYLEIIKAVEKSILFGVPNI